MSILEIAKMVFEIEKDGLCHVSKQLDVNFEQSVTSILSSKGRTIVCGMGKSGIIGKKIAASFASTGTPSFFMHPGEAFHGDLGMVTKDDVFIAISNSGETDEVLKLLPFLKDNSNIIVAMTGNSNSTLAQNAHYHLNIGVEKEACPLQLAPTASTTATLAMGDALTIALMQSRKFKPENFARFHPGGSLGRKLLNKVQDEMQTINLPIVTDDLAVKDLIQVITECMYGLAIVVKRNQLIGLVTDGDLRRSFEKFGKNVFDKSTKDIMSHSPKTISPLVSMQKAIEFMESYQINNIIVIEDSEVVGILKK
ncbi:arabinose-5-phosphate isomerase [Lentisphaera araneosa HTCC2155]|uniref:Arabinose-5-phosphate isomerase n=1 Tax=Lentisphaera araneosa HTCC2155 TaxID=313628 RepID=A6DQH5_9BACT|nr:KpsF/GutQ family sugar-phosphate isomerase [Lentisphaera araneosa]EDM26056.1 arabinose-5-phosphate isomerase [Lentisphaera araneosa HTCC2155]